MFVFHQFVPQKWLFLSPEVPEGHKRDKKLSPSSVWGDKRGTKLNFYDNVNYIKIRAYLIDYQQGIYLFCEILYLSLEKL